MDTIKVAIADDHKIFRKGVILSLKPYHNIKFVLEAENGEELIQGVESAGPDIILMDLQMPAPEGLNCLAEIRRRELPVQVLVLTAFGDGESIQFALENGADGFALKTAPLQQTIDAIRQVGHGNMVFPPAARKWA